MVSTALDSPDSDHPPARGKLSRVAYERFKALLGEGRLPLGESLSQAALVRIVGVPISPLREAIQVLEAEGLVTVNGRSGIHVTRPDLQTIKDRFQVRMVLEQAGLRKFAETCAPADLEPIVAEHQELWAEAPSITDDGLRLRRSRKLDIDFHGLIMSRIHNRVLLDMYLKNQDHLLLVRLAPEYRASPYLVRVAIEEHMRIIERLVGQDIPGAEQMLGDHLIRSMHRALGL